MHMIKKTRKNEHEMRVRAVSAFLSSKLSSQNHKDIDLSDSLHEFEKEHLKEICDSFSQNGL